MSAPVDDPLFEALSEGVCVLDAERRIVRYNRRFLEVTGLTADVLQPGERLAGALAYLTTHGEFASPAQREDVIAKFRAAGSEPFAYRRERRDGTFFEMRGRPLPEGGFILVAEDMTERRRAESTLRASDVRMRQAFAQASVAINICDADGRYLEANDAFCRMVGYSLAELRELSFEAITHPDDVAHETSFGLESFDSDEQCRIFEKRYVHRDGSIVWGKVSVSMMRDEEGWPTNTIAIVEDITAQKRAIEARRESETLLTRALESINEGFALFDPAGKLVVMNRHYSGYFPDGDSWVRQGMTFEEITRAGIARGAYRLAPGTEEAFLAERLATRGRGEATVFQTSEGRWLRAHDYRTSDGSMVALRSDVTELMQRTQALADSEERFRSLANNLPGVVFTVELDPKTGQRRLTYLGDTLPAALHIDRDAARRGEIGLIHSMPPQDAAAYLAAMEKSARDMTPMAVDVRFIGGASQQWTRIAATPRRLPNGVVRWDGIGLDITEQRADLTRRLLAFAHRPALKPETLDINRLVADIVPLLERALGGGVEVALEPAAALSVAHVDRGQLENAVLNLATNARDAMPGGGRVAIAITRVSLDAAEAARIGDIAASDYVRISVTDQGSGMSPDIVERVTEPFFTTKPEDQGTGLGLSMVYGFVHQSGGAMAIDSTPGKGTTVHLYLPRVAVGAADGTEALLVTEAAR